MRKLGLLFIMIFFIESCVILTGYALIQTVKDINNIIKAANSSLGKINAVIEEGKELKRAYQDGKLITTLAEKIPTLIRNQIEKPIKQEIENLANDLKITSTELNKNLLAEDLIGSKKSYYDVTKSYNNIADFVNKKNPFNKE